MNSPFGKNKAQCSEFQLQLEELSEAAPNATNISELLASLPVSLRDHASACEDCLEAADTVLESRAMMEALPSSAEIPGQWFAPRVMAAIAARKNELARATDTWTFLPKLAARLTWVSAVALLLASSWLYQKPVTHSMSAVATDITGEPVVDNVTPANNDEVLLSLAERPR